jgi:hypothetical protein
MSERLETDIIIAVYTRLKRLDLNMKKLYLGKCHLTRDNCYVIRKSSFKNVHKIHKLEV